MKRNSKRFIALLMCVLTATSALIFNNVFAAEGVSKIDSYASLVEKYGTAVGDDGLTDGFVYIGAEFYEEDGTLTDYIVNPGDKLTVKLYLKSNMYTSDCRLITVFDNDFFDIKIVDDNVPTDAYGYTSMHETAPINNNHPMVIDHGITHTVTSINLNRVGWIKNICGFTEEYLESFDLVDNQTYIDTKKADTPYEMTSDEWLLSYYVYVKEGLPAGTKGIVDSPDALWQSSICDDPNVKGLYGKHDARKQAKVPVHHITEHVENAGDFTQMAFELDNGTLDYFIIDDLHHEFTIADDVQATDPIYPPEETTETPEYPTDEPTEVPTDDYPDEPETEYPTAPEYPTEPPTTFPDVTETDASIYIRTPSVNEIQYGDCITLHAVVSDIPEGAEIVWTMDNANFAVSCSIDRKSCTIHPRESGSTVFTVKVIDENGNVLCEDEIIMSSKAGFLWKIIAFFKQLFGLNQVIPELFN